MAFGGTILTSTELSEALNKRGYPFSAERIDELAKSNYIPFLLVDGKHYRYLKKETSQFITENLVSTLETGAYPVVLPVVVPPDSIDCPYSLRKINRHLVNLPDIFHSGVYFLCLEGEVVYVGQSINVANRLSEHLRTKIFDRVFILPIIKYNLDIVETAFILLLKPRYNITNKGRLSTPVSCDGPIIRGKNGFEDVTIDDVVENYL